MDISPYLDYILYGIIAILIIILIAVVVNEKSYKYKVRVRVLTGTKKLVWDEKAKIIRKKNEPEKLYLRKSKDYLPTPPPDAIDITPKGRQIIEVYKIAEKQYKYLVDDNSLINVIEPVFNEKTGEVEFKYTDGVKNLKFRIFNSNDKEFLVNQYRIALERKGAKWQDHIPMITSGIVLITVFVIALAFYPQIIEKAGELVDKLAVIADKMDASIRVIDSCQNIQPVGVAPN